MSIELHVKLKLTYTHKTILLSFLFNLLTNVVVVMVIHTPVLVQTIVLEIRIRILIRHGNSCLNESNVPIECTKESKVAFVLSEKVFFSMTFGRR